MAREIELKFELTDEHAARLGASPLLAGASAQSTRQLTLYYDTAKGEVRKSGFSLRVRNARGGFVQTVKPLSSGAGLFARGEWERQVGSLEPDLAALASTPLRALTRNGFGKLRPVIRSEVERRQWTIRHQGSELSVDLDQGIMIAEGRSDRFTELELELVSGSEAGLVDAARSLAEQVPVRIGVLSKAERGFALADGSLGKVAKAGPVAVRPDMSVAEGFTVIVHSSLRHFRRNEPIVAERRQAEALHQARVAMRRLRSAFSLFKPAIVDEDFEPLRQELRWFTNLLGEARNLDVYLQRGDIGRPGPELLCRREQAYDTIIEGLGSKRFLGLMFELVAWLAAGRWRSGSKASKPLLPFAGKRLDRMWRRIASTGELAAINDAARHELRIEVKKLRYSLEFFRALFPGHARQQKRFADSVEALQELLGELNDIVTARLFAPQAGELAPPVAEAKSADELIAEAERCLGRMRKIGPYWRLAG